MHSLVLIHKKLHCQGCITIRAFISSTFHKLPCKNLTNKLGKYRLNVTIDNTEHVRSLRRALKYFVQQLYHSAFFAEYVVRVMPFLMSYSAKQHCEQHFNQTAMYCKTKKECISIFSPILLRFLYKVIKSRDYFLFFPSSFCRSV